MAWIVIGEEKGRIKLVSKSGVDAILPKGSYLTVENGASRFILRVDDSAQDEPYAPSPMIVDMDLTGLIQDQKCQNIIFANRVKDVTSRTDGMIDFIPPQATARRSNQEEIDMAIGAETAGPRVFVATVHGGQNQLLIDDNRNFITTRLPIDMFYHQTLICGKTGSGKTVSTKYLAQYFTEELEGAVLAINVKDIDFLMMNFPSTGRHEQVRKEWGVLGKKAHGIDNYVIYYPANTSVEEYRTIDQGVCKKITLDVKTIEPEALTGLLQGISDVGAQSFPNIFRYWQQRVMKEGGTFGDFVSYFIKGEDDNRVFQTLNSREDISEIPLHKGTYDNILRTISVAIDFFDNKGAKTLSAKDILVKGKMSVINVTGNKGIQFGSIMLRHLLHKIVEAKSQQELDVPILIIIDEVHQFYNSNSSLEALGDLDTICRTGRNKKIGVIFSSQSPSDIPRGLASVINTKIFFKSDAATAKSFGVNVSSDEMESLKKGFAVANIHDLSQLKILKFPLAYAGVIE
ncbi:MAG: ATP-binding protein [Candidatus Omnitrophica bacterium]|nr:ATP-binding protein [Candidatus Omnitrophota bacterium]MCG2705335.1 ATP-binding protein [Candidatus Omnitrophota bacterium]